MKPGNEQLKRGQRDLQVQRAQKAKRMNTDANPEINQELQARLAAARLQINTSHLNLNGIYIRETDTESIRAFLSAHAEITSLNYSLPLDHPDYMMGSDGKITQFRAQGGAVNANAFLTALQDNSTLNELRLDFINNLPGIYQALATFLRANRWLRCLSLDENNMEDPEALILSEALKSNMTLTNLNLYGNQIGTNGKAALKEVEDARNEAAELARAQKKALEKNTSGEPKALLHDFHQYIPVKSVRSLIAAYNEMPRLTIKP